MDMLTEMRNQGIISSEDFEAQMAAAGLAQHTAPEEVEVELGDEQIGQVEGVIEAIEHREAVYNAQESTVTVDSIVEATPGAPVEAPAAATTEKPKRVKKASGTARSQAQQLGSVLKTLGIVTADMRANPNSTLLSKFAA